MYLNLKGFSLPHGLGVGGSVENFRLFIPESLEECTAGASCTTFEYGTLASGKTFDLNALEVRWLPEGGGEGSEEGAGGGSCLVRRARVPDRSTRGVC
jgi:hypothetical protein